MVARATPLQLTKRLAIQLAGLNGASPDAVEETIALWPLGWRISLAAHGIIDTHPDEAAARRGETTDFTLTERGRRVIEECARWHAEALKEGEAQEAGQGAGEPHTPRAVARELQKHATSQR
jgi:hypothetical protein